MKKIFIISVISLIQCFCYGQTQFDEIISVNFPGQIEVIDTIIQGQRINGNYYNSADASYSLVKLMAGDKNDNLSKLPHDKSSLEIYYRSVLKGHARKLAENELVLIDSSFIKIDDYIGISAFFGIDKSDTTTHSHFLLVDDNLYNFNYFSYNNYKQSKSIDFINSVKITNPKIHNQFVGTSKAERQGYIAGKIVFWGIVILLIIYAVKKL